MQEQWLTVSGKRKLEDELAALIDHRKDQIAILSEHSDAQFGDDDSGDGAIARDAKYHKSEIEDRIKEIKTKLRNCKVINASCIQDPSIVQLGSKLSLLFDGETDPEEYTIVDSDETDPDENKISTESPVAKAAMGHKAGEEIVFSAPDGQQRAKILTVEISDFLLVQEEQLTECTV